MILITVCARKGSQGLPGKNERPFMSGGSPLARAMDFSFRLQRELDHHSGEMVEVVLSTDIQIPEADVPTFWFRERPEELRGPLVHKWHVLRDMVSWYEEHSLQEVDCVLDLDVTRPIRYVDDCVDLMGLFQEWRPDVAMTVARAKKHPAFDLWEGETADPYLRLYDSDGGWAGARQELSPVWQWGGEWVIDADYLKECHPGAVFSGKVLGHEVTRETSFDVDDELDWVVLEAVGRYLEGRE